MNVTRVEVPASIGMVMPVVLGFVLRPAVRHGIRDAWRDQT